MKASKPVMEKDMIVFKPAASVSLLAVFLVAACVTEPLADYRPVVDPARSNSAKFEKDLVACRNLALKVEADYKKRQGDEMMTNMVVGALLGAAVGAAVGNSDTAAYGAAAGAAGGAAAGDYDQDLVKFGPRRIVDRCMADRGHSILNDIGRG